MKHNVYPSDGGRGRAVRVLCSSAAPRPGPLGAKVTGPADVPRGLIGSPLGEKAPRCVSPPVVHALTVRASLFLQLVSFGCVATCTVFSPGWFYGPALLPAVTQWQNKQTATKKNIEPASTFSRSAVSGTRLVCSDVHRPGHPLGRVCGVPALPASPSNKLRLEMVERLVQQGPVDGV